MLFTRCFQRCCPPDLSDEDTSEWDSDADTVIDSEMEAAAARILNELQSRVRLPCAHCGKFEWRAPLGAGYTGFVCADCHEESHVFLRRFQTPRDWDGPISDDE